MRVQVDKWILTTLKETKDEETNHQLNSSTRNDVIIEQQIQLEQQLFQEGSIDGDKPASSIHQKIPNQQGLDINFELINNGNYKKFKMFEPDIDQNNSDGNNSGDNSSMSFTNQISIPINHSDTSSSSNTWQAFHDLLEKCLDLFTFRQVLVIIDECLKLENYLNSEFQLNEKELYFTSQKQIIEHLNGTLREKIFSLSQSTELFNKQKTKLVDFLTPVLSENPLNDVVSTLEKLEHKYLQLVESIKSRLKLKMAKYETNLNTWNEFDKTCLKLNLIFEANLESEESSNLQYRGLLIEISSYLNNLKEFLSLLSSICTESKYFEMKNLIIVYEIKFKRMREKHETMKSNQEFQIKYFTKSSEYEENYYENNDSNCQVQPHSERKNEFSYESGNATPICIPKFGQKNTLRNRNSRNLIKDQQITSPQTDKVYSRPRLFNPYGFDELNNQQVPIRQTVETSDKSTFTVNEISTQTEHYLCNNFYTSEHNLRTIDQHHFAASKNSPKRSNNSAESDGKKLLLEAYLRNNENPENIGSSRSSSCLLPKQNNKRKSITTTGTRESGIGTYIDDEIATSSCDLEFIKARSDKKIDYQTDNESLSKLNDNSSFNDSCYIKKIDSKKFSSKKFTKRSDSQHKQQSQSTKQSTQSQKDQGALGQKSSSFSWFFKTLICFLLFFLTVIFIIMVFFFHTLFLNPGCCDFQRNYLMFNIS